MKKRLSVSHLVNPDVFDGIREPYSCTAIVVNAAASQLPSKVTFLLYLPFSFVGC